MEQLDPAAEAFPDDGLGPIDEWSKEIYRGLAKRPVAAEGVWTRCEPGYLLLSIERLHGEAIDPIMINTDDEDLTLGFGGWHTHLPEKAVDAPGAVEEAIGLINRWISGELRTLIFKRADGRWAGSMTILREELVQEVADGSDWFGDSPPTHAELRTPRKSEWAHFANDNGQWKLVPPPGP